uniref:Uncharacterized protein n=1 Tax=Oryza sativa subsp. indica TaxID=39946 RepID=A0A679B8X0_ORYSI|nr:hypothetical protein [Oryza sativa Indica Group]
MDRRRGGQQATARVWQPWLGEGGAAWMLWGRAWMPLAGAAETDPPVDVRGQQLSQRGSSWGSERNSGYGGWCVGGGSLFVAVEVCGGLGVAVVDLPVEAYAGAGGLGSAVARGVSAAKAMEKGVRAAAVEAGSGLGAAAGRSRQQPRRGGGGRRVGNSGRQWPCGAATVGGITCPLANTSLLQAVVSLPTKKPIFAGLLDRWAAHPPAKTDFGFS